MRNLTRFCSNRIYQTQWEQTRTVHTLIYNTKTINQFNLIQFIPTIIRINLIQYSPILSIQPTDKVIKSPVERLTTGIRPAISPILRCYVTVLRESVTIKCYDKVLHESVTIKCYVKVLR